MKGFIKFVSVVLALCMIVSCFSGCTVLMDYRPNPEKYLDTDFESMDFTMPNVSRFYTLGKQIEEISGKFYNAIKVQDCFNEMVDIYNSIFAVKSILSIRTSLNVNDAELAEDYLYLQNETISVRNELNRVANIIKNSPCAFMVEFYNGKEVWQSFEAYDPSDEGEKEFEKLSIKENELVSKINQLDKKVYTIPAEDVEGFEAYEDYSLYSSDAEFSLKELEHMYTDGVIATEEYLALQREIYVQENAAYGELYLELVEVRKAIAKNRGFETYGEYAYSEIYSRAYSVSDVKAMRSYVKKELVPLYNEMVEALDYDALSESDEYMSKMYSTKLEEMIKPILESVSTDDHDMLEVFEDMVKNNRCSFYYSDNKANISFTTYIDCYNVPYMFCSPSFKATGYDFSTVVHEFGHYYAYSTVPLTEYNIQDLDAQEVASQGLEMIFAEYISDIYPNNDMANAQYLYILINVLGAVIEGCKMDEFQERVFASDLVTISDINKIYGDILTEYGTDFYDIGNGEALSWIDVTHTFIAPFYYVSYASSALVALQIWSTDDSSKVYFDFLANTETMNFMDNIKKCGFESPFNEESLKAIKGVIEERLEAVYGV